MEYFEEHPSILIGVQNYGKIFTEIFTPVYLKNKPNESTEKFLSFIESMELNNPINEEEINGTTDTQETEESSNNLS